MKKIIHQVMVVLEVMFARLRFLAVFVVAGLVVGYWDNIKNHVDKWTRPAVAPDALVGTTSAVEYYCVMHPNVIRSEPGNCPICGMPLVKRKKGEKQELPEGAMARVQLTPRRIALAGTQTSVVERRKLVHEIQVPGALDYNEMKVAQLSARVAGRADQLFVRYTGQAVKQGEPVYSLYSPEVYTAMREYLEARKRVNELAKSGMKDAIADASAVYNASMQKLVLWGISSEQLDKLDKEYDQTQKIPTHIDITSPISGIVVRKNIYEGGYVQTGDTPYTIADLGTLWLQARIYEDDVPLVKVGDEADVVVDAMPNEAFKGKVTFLAYQLDPQTRTLAGRVEVGNPELKLRPGMFAEARIVEQMGGGGGDEGAKAGRGEGAKKAGDPQTAVERARVYQEGLKIYLQAHKRLVEDKSEGVSELLHEVLKKLEPIAKEPGVSKDYEALTAAVMPQNSVRKP
jgi:Cu(I)/Ag(I) efflux system membrane fusion protein